MRVARLAVVLASSLVGFAAGQVDTNKTMMLFDFTSPTGSDPSEWIEQSDPVRSVGMSKAVFALQKTQVFRRAVFFALLNPQPNGAGFAGVRTPPPYRAPAELARHEGIELRCRAQGEHDSFKVVLRHRGLNDEPNPTYEQMFQGPREFTIVRLPFAQFKAYYRGREVDDAEPLDRARVTSVGLQFYGGVYMPVKQRGPATLEVDWIRAYGGDNNAV